MSALSHEFDLAQATMLPPIGGFAPGMVPDIDTLTEQWEAVHEAAGAVAALAQLGGEAPPADLADLPARAAAGGGWRYDMTARAIEDIAAFMQPGLRALLALTARGQDTTAAALTLWREFHSARSAIIELAEAA